MRMLKRLNREWRKITRRKKRHVTPQSYFQINGKRPWDEPVTSVKVAPVHARPFLVPDGTGKASAAPIPSTREIAVLEPILVPYVQAQTALKNAVRKITEYDGFMMLHVFDLSRQKRSYTVKNGIWAGEKMRMFFAKNSQQKLERFFIGINECGYPVIKDPQAPFSAEVRMVAVEDIPTENIPANNPVESLEPISATGQLPEWAVKIKQIIETKDICGTESGGNDRSLIEIADELHEIACDILGLNPETIPRKDDVEAAFKGRIQVVHPDKTRSYIEDADNIAQALLWAKKFLYPFK